MRLVLVGIGHVFDLGPALRPLIALERPEVVALELDPQRLQGLVNRRAGRLPSAEERKRTPRLYRYLARFQDSVADSFGVQAGDEMLVAAEAAEAAGAKVVCIDRNAQEAVQETIRRMRLREKAKFVWMGVQSLFARQSKKTVEREVQRYHDDPEAYLGELGREFPTLKAVLIDERNQHMAAGLRRLASEHATVVGVVGDGHVPGLVRLLSNLKPTVYRLKDLQRTAAASGVRWRKTEGRNGVGFSFEAESPEATLRRD